MTIKGLAHIGIRVRDMEASLAFYTKLLGFTLTHRQMAGTSELAFLQNGTCLLELIHPQNYDERTPGQIDHVALEVQHIEQIVDFLKKNGVIDPSAEIGEMPNLLDGVKNIFFCGPDGERIEFFDYVNRY